MKIKRQSKDALIFSFGSFQLLTILKHETFQSNWQTHRKTKDRQADLRTDKQTNRQTSRLTDRQTDTKYDLRKKATLISKE